MRSRIFFVAGLALFWPFLQGPYFSMFFGAGDAAPMAGLPFAFNALVILFSILIALVPGHRWGARHGGRLLLGSSLLSTVLLGLGALGLGAGVLPWIAAPCAAAAFGALACGWAQAARRRCAWEGPRAVFFEVALAYAACYGIVFAVQALPGSWQAPVWALCPAGSVLCWAQAVRDDEAKAPGAAALPAALEGPRRLLPAAVACVALVSAVLAGLFSDAPARSYGASAACALVLLGCAALGRRRSVWISAAWVLALVPVLMSGFCIMAFASDYTWVGIDALTLGRRLLWVLYWWLLASGPRAAGEEDGLPRTVALGFAPVYAATRLIIDGLRVGAPGLAADPALASMAATAVALVLEVASLAVVGLVVAVHVHVAAHGGAAAPPAEEDLRAAACARVAGEFGLTERERDVLELVSMGYTVQRIAEERGVSQNTVRTHTKGLYRKLDIHSKQEAIELVNARMG